MPTDMQTFIAGLRKKDDALKVGSLADFDMNSRDSFTTGNVSLDNATGVGGFPRGRIVELFGPNQSGKTTSALQCAAAHQQRVQAGTDTGAILFLDYERSLDETYCAALGLDVNDASTFIYSQPRNFEQGANLFRDLMGEGFLALGIADSVAAMVSEKELNAKTGAATMADRAKALAQFCRQITGALHDHKTTIIFLNHVMDLIDTSPMGQQMAARGIKRKTTPGGTALPFYSSMRIEYSQIGTHKGSVFNPVLNEDEDVVVATTVQAKVIKNKVSKPQRIAKMRVRYGRGFSQPYSILQVLLAHKIIKKSGSWLTVPEQYSPNPGEAWRVQGEEAIIGRLEVNHAWREQMLALTHDLIAQWDPSKDTDDFEIDPSIDPETGEIKTKDNDNDD